MTEQGTELEILRQRILKKQLELFESNLDFLLELEAQPSREKRKEVMEKFGRDRQSIMEMHEYQRLNSKNFKGIIDQKNGE